MIDQFQKLLVMFIYGVSSIKFHFIDVFQNFNIVIATITECLKKKKKNTLNGPGSWKKFSIGKIEVTNAPI